MTHFPVKWPTQAHRQITIKTISPQKLTVLGQNDLPTQGTNWAYVLTYSTRPSTIPLDKPLFRTITYQKMPEKGLFKYSRIISKERNSCLLAITRIILQRFESAKSLNLCRKIFMISNQHILVPGLLNKHFRLSHAYNRYLVVRNKD